MNQKGFTLTESLLALAILGIAMVGILPTFLTYMDSNTLSEERTQAVGAAQRVMETLRHLEPKNLPSTGSDPVEIVEKYGERLIVLHLKDWLLTNPEIGLDRWSQRGRFCELGAGNIGLDNLAVMKALKEVGYDGWVFIEHDTHLQDPLKDLAISLKYLRDGGF